MTAPGALPPPRSVYEAPALAPSEMTAGQQEQHRVAQVATAVAAAGLAKQAISNQITLLLVPLLRAMDPFDDESVAAFAVKAAELVEIGRQEVGKVSWGTIQAQLAAYGVLLPSDYTDVGRGRRTALEVAYRRVANDYRRRIAAGPESIQGLIAQMEEERFQQLGGATVAQDRTGESNAKIEGQNRSLGSGGSSSSTSRSGGAGASKGSRGASKGDGGTSQQGVSTPPRDRAVNTTQDDWDAQDAAEQAARDAEDAAADAAFDAEQELRRQAALTEEEKLRVLDQAAQHDMEMRAERMVNDDMAMASRAASQDAMKAAPAGKVTGYRRVLHPELSQSQQSCGLCIAASHRKYKVGELLPIHNLCKCECVPIIDGNDPGAQINDEDLGILYDEAGGSTLKEDLIGEKYVVFNHPELGPVLRNAKHSQGAIKFSRREASEDHKLAVKKRERAFHEKRAESFGTPK
ncbi:hypothetical protein SEA_APIARY_30 [Rhodococcus phage Apiary]|nr:hypothetical protein SEA_APIARY_30 [Rhodococcus phage Apiary]